MFYILTDPWPFNFYKCLLIWWWSNVKSLKINRTSLVLFPTFKGHYVNHLSQVVITYAAMNINALLMINRTIAVTGLVMTWFKLSFFLPNIIVFILAIKCFIKLNLGGGGYVGYGHFKWDRLRVQSWVKLKTINLVLAASPLPLMLDLVLHKMWMWNSMSRTVLPVSIITVQCVGLA